MTATLIVATGLVAGLATSPHCVLMCGPLQVLPDHRGRARRLVPLHAGRIAGYAVLGALAGEFGLRLLRQLPSVHLGLAIQLFAALFLIGIGLRRWYRPASHCGRCPGHERTNGGGFAHGLLRAALPCAALYAMLFLGASWRDPVQGALLLAAFGVGTLPALAGTGLLMHRYGLVSRAPAAALLLVASGVLAAVTLALHDPAELALCLASKS